MNKDAPNDLTLRRYLLGTLSIDLQQLVEVQVLTDPLFLNRLQMVEDELIDEFLHGHLSLEEEGRFGSFFLLPPERQRKLEFAKALHRRIALNPSSNALVRIPLWQRMIAWWRIPCPVPAGVLVAALLLLALGGGWVSVKFRQLQQSSMPNNSAAKFQTENPAGIKRDLAAEQTHTEKKGDEVNGSSIRQKQQAPELATEMPPIIAGSRQPGNTLHPTMLSFSLTAALVRGMEASRKVIIPTSLQLVQFHLDLGMETYKKYRVVLRDMEGKELWFQFCSLAESDQAGSLQIILPAALLPSGDYILKLYGVKEDMELDEAGNFYFRVIKK